MLRIYDKTNVLKLFVDSQYYNKLHTHVQAEVFYRMAGVWCVYCHRCEIRYCNIPYTTLVYLYFVLNNGLTTDYLHGFGILAEHKKVHLVSKKKPFKIPLKTLTAGD